MDAFGPAFGPPSDAAGSAFNPPPGWPEAPAGWNFWGPAGGAAAAPGPAVPGAAVGELRLSLEGKDFTVRPGETARIGRSPDNDLITDVPFVSRQHAVVRQGASQWVFEN